MAEGLDVIFMKRCIDLAGMAAGMTYPNPMAGSVIVHRGIIIGEGYHKRAGGSHAEVIAINSVSDRSLLRESTVYVSLEPCSHFGKTPPCADLIAELGIPRVVAGTKDTSSKVSGRGFRRLSDAGCEVVTGICEDECRWLNRRFFTFHEKRRPYIILKWARSRDGFIDTDRPAGSETGPFWITGKSERVLVHKWRSEEQAILAGGATIRKDNPALTVRDWTGNNPIRLVLTRSGDLGNYPYKTETKSPLVAFTSNIEADLGDAEKVILSERCSPSQQIAEYLYEKGIQSLFIEGGARLITHFAETGMWDEARIFTGDRIFRTGIRSPEIKGRSAAAVNFLSSRLDILVND